MRIYSGLLFYTSLTSALLGQIGNDPGVHAIDRNETDLILEIDHDHYLYSNPQWPNGGITTGIDYIEVVADGNTIYGRGYTDYQNNSFHIWGTMNSQGDWDLNIAMDPGDPQPYDGYLENMLDGVDDHVDNYATARENLYNDLVSDQRDWNELNEDQRDIVDHMDEQSFDDIIYYADEQDLDDMVADWNLSLENWDKVYEEWLKRNGWVSP